MDFTVEELLAYITFINDGERILHPDKHQKWWAVVHRGCGCCEYLDDAPNAVPEGIQATHLKLQELPS